jgi:hypothetical protein
MPIFSKDTPYYTPLSTPISLFPTSILTLAVGIVQVIAFRFIWIAVALSATIYYCFTCSWVVICSCTGARNCHGVHSNDDIRARLVHRGREIWNQFKKVSYHMKLFFDDICSDSPRWAFRRWNRRDTAEAITLKQLSKIDLGILGWTIRSLGEDDALEKFFDAIPGFFDSKLVKVPKIDFESYPKLYIKLSSALDGFLRRTLSSNSVTDSVKIVGSTSI